jgi:CheY-like chemotaxis protein
MNDLMSDSILEGLRVFIVEDEGMLTMLMEDFLDELGCEVADTADTIETALSKAESANVDAAIVDVNLNGSASTAVADILTRRGIPFLFATGYGQPPGSAYSGVGVLAKPFQKSDLERALATLMRNARARVN